MRTILDRRDAADRRPVSHGEKEPAIRCPVKRVCLRVQRVTDGDPQRRDPLWVLGRIVDLPGQIDEPAKGSRRVDGPNFE
jgi:hypothetical protein